MEARRFLFKKIDIENFDQISKELIEYSNNNLPIDFNGDFYKFNFEDVLRKCPLIREWFKLKKVSPNVCAIIITNNKPYLEGMHTDKHKNHLALNFGIRVPPESYTGLYEFRNGQWNELDRYYLDGPIILNTKISHWVYTPSLRLVMTFRFAIDPWKLVL